MMAEASINKVDKHFAHKSFMRFKEKCIVNDRGCWIPNKVPRKDGYVRYSITKGSAKQAFGPNAPEKEVTLYVHHLAWYATDHRMPTPREEHLSHLCSDSRCFNPDHLRVETPEVNNSRKNCGFLFDCGCGETILACFHEPKCIGRRRGVVPRPPLAEVQVQPDCKKSKPT